MDMTEQEPKVYVVQEQMRFDRDSRQMVPRFPSISRATMYGELVYLLSPTAAPFSSESIVKELHFKLKTQPRLAFSSTVAQPSEAQIALILTFHEDLLGKGRENVALAL